MLEFLCFTLIPYCLFFFLLSVFPTAEEEHKAKDEEEVDKKDEDEGIQDDAANDAPDSSASSHVIWQKGSSRDVFQGCSP